MLRASLRFCQPVHRHAATSVPKAVSSATAAPRKEGGPVAAADAARAFGAFDQLMVRSFRLDKVLERMSATDVVVARQDPARFQFIGFQDLSAAAVSRALLLVPDHMRHFHSVCARRDTPVDFFADIDLPLEADAEDVLLQVTDRLDAKLKALRFGPTTTIVLSAAQAHKQSFHIHVQGSSSAFRDYRGVRDLADCVNQQMDTPVLDMAPYRPGGSLRAAYCAKITGRTAGNSRYDNHLVPYAARDDELRRRIAAAQELSPEDIFRASLAVRQDKVRLYNGITEAPASAGVTAVGGQPQLSRFMRESAKWLRYKHVQERVRALPDSAAADYTTWINVGLALHSFGAERHILDEWCRFSLRCPEKFSRDACEGKWLTFNKGHDGDSWRRGYNYLATTIWRRIQS